MSTSSLIRITPPLAAQASLSSSISVSVRMMGFGMALKPVPPPGGSSIMTETDDLSAAWRRVNAFPALTLENADRLARDYGLTINGPDGEGVVWAVMADPKAGVRRGVRLGKARSKTARAWLAWRDG